MNGALETVAASVIIPCRGHAIPLDACLKSLLNQRLEGCFEILVVDSDADPAVAEVCRRYSSVRLIRCSEGLLPGAARNLGAAHAKGQYLAFIDADCIAEPGWLEAMIDALDGTVLVGGSVRDGKPWHPVATMDNYLQFAAQPAGRPRGIERLLPSCSLAIPRADFEAIGGFPSVDEPAGEDGLFCMKVADRWSGQSLFVPNARIRHYGRETMRQLWIHQYRFGHARGALSLQLTPFQRKLGRYRTIMPLIGLKRMSWLVGCAARWQPLKLLQMLMFSPILLIGMTAWCVGFRKGCAENETTRPMLEGAACAAK